MSKLSIRVILSVLVSLGIILAVFTSVQGASADNNLGSNPRGGAAVNLTHDWRAASGDNGAKQDGYDDFRNEKGGGCESESFDSSDL